MQQYFDACMATLNTAQEIYARDGLEGLLNHADENIYVFGVAIETGDSHHLAI